MRVIDHPRHNSRRAAAFWRISAILWCLLALWQPTFAALGHLELVSGGKNHDDCGHWQAITSRHTEHESGQFERATPSLHQHHDFLIGATGAEFWRGQAPSLEIYLPTSRLADERNSRLDTTALANATSRGPPATT